MKRYRISVKAGFGFFLVTAAACCFGGEALCFIAAAAVHEAGHIAAMLLLADCRMRIRLTASGIYIDPRYRCEPDAVCKAMILAAGPALGLALAAAAKGTKLCSISLALSVVNLLPAAGTDGGSLLRLLPVFSEHEQAALWVGYAAVTALAAAALLPVLSGGEANLLWLAAAALLLLRQKLEREHNK